jgi:hypothetical protein
VVKVDFFAPRRRGARPGDPHLSSTTAKYGCPDQVRARRLNDDILESVDRLACGEFAATFGGRTPRLTDFIAV